VPFFLSKRRDAGIGYKTLTEDLRHFGQASALPSSIDIRRFDDGSGIEKTLSTKQ
jgi:hypothetical protein